VRGLLQRHIDLTGSPRAAWILEHWADAQPRFIKVFPHEYKRVLAIAPRADGLFIFSHNFVASGGGRPRCSHG
jgi:glutamate synthase domain-containing protein 3